MNLFSHVASSSAAAAQRERERGEGIDDGVKWREKWRREGEKRGRRGWRDSKFGIPPNNFVAHGLDMRHRIEFF